MAGSTAGVAVCFILPGALHVGALRLEAGRGVSGNKEESGGVGDSYEGGIRAAARWVVPRSLDEAAGFGMVVAGILSGVVSLCGTLASFGE